MENAKHTPGPWRVGEEAGSEMIVYAPDGFAVASTVVFHRNHDQSKSANARLIAAAPELLEALIAFRDGGAGKNFDSWHESYRPAIDKAIAAIAKATGGAA